VSPASIDLLNSIASGPSGNRMDHKRRRSNGNSSRKRTKVNRRVATVHSGSTSKKRVTKVKPGNLKLGVSKKFAKKVEKVITFSQNYGRYSYVSDSHFYQTTLNSYSIVQADLNTSPIEFFSPYRFLDAQSILWGGKVATANFNNTTNNMDDNSKIHVVNSYATLFFKSCSQHVVNLEIYECTAKVSQNVGPGTLINQSYGTYATQFTSVGGTAVSNATSIGSRSDEWVDLYKYFNVKVHRLKFLPGESSSLTINGPTNRTIDLSQCSTNGTMNYFAKGMTKAIWVRVLNDPTLSKDLTPNRVHNYPSTVAGGVSCRMAHVVKLRPPPNSAVVSGSVAKATNSFHESYFGSALVGTDQQVLYHDPGSIPVGPL